MPFDKEVTVIEARDWIKEKKTLQLIDVRPADEFEKVSIKGFQNIPLSELSRSLPELNIKSIALIISHHGEIAHKAQTLLQACEIKSFMIRGGIDDWSQIIDLTLKRY